MGDTSSFLRDRNVIDQRSVRVGRFKTIRGTSVYNENIDVTHVVDYNY